MEDHGARQHHRFGGSGMGRLILCPGSYNMSRAVPPETPSRAAMRGTLAHEIMDHALKGGMRSADDAAMPWIANELLDDDIVAGVQVALDFVYDILDQYGDEAELYCEDEFIIESMADDDVGGYCDVAIWIPSLKLLYVIDYKNGVGVVEVGDNAQLKFYATGAVQKHFDAADTIIGVIVQPNAFHKDGKIREAYWFRSTMEDFAVTIDEAIFAAKDPNAPLIPGEYQCEWCPARAFCPAREAAALQVVNYTFSTVRHVSNDIARARPNIPNPFDMSGERLAEILLNAQFLRDFLSDVEKAAYEKEMTTPGSVPGFKLVEAQARRKWFGEPRQVADALAQLLGADDDVVFPRKLMTITEAERRLKQRYTAGLTKKADKDKALQSAYEYLARLTNKDTSGNLTLVPESDKRPAAGRQVPGVTFGTVMLPPT